MLIDIRKEQNFRKNYSLTANVTHYLRYVYEIISPGIILEPEILGNHNINNGTTLLLKTIVN